MSKRIDKHWPTIIRQFQEHLSAMKSARREAPGSAGIAKPFTRGRRIIFEIDIRDPLGTLTFMYHATKGWRVRAVS